MEFDENSSTIVNILNNVLKNINDDIAHLRADFKKLSDLVLILSVKVDDSKSIRDELKLLSAKVEIISSRIYELEKAKDKLEFLIAQVDKNQASHDALSDLSTDNRINELTARFKVYDERFPLLWRVLGAIVILICITLYVTKSYNEALSLIGKIFAIF